MLTVQPLKSAKGAADYYTAAYNYYANDAGAIRWHGRGAEKLGLSPEVSKEQVLALLEGRLPDGTVLQDSKGRHRPGFDMTFSAPKSLSILTALDADKSLLAMHDKAVALAIQEIEQEFAQTRVRIGGKISYVNTKNFVIAAFRQPSSRENDPNIHTHAVVMNMTFDEQGKARSLASDIHAKQGVVEQLQRSATYGGMLYRTHLANMLKDSGYTLISKPNGLFEIAGMPEQVMKAFSRRRTNIEKCMQEKGWVGSHGASSASLLTRPSKEEHDIHKLKADWFSRAHAMGFDGKEFVREHLALPLESPFDLIPSDHFYTMRVIEQQRSLEAVEVAIETVGQQSSVFDYRTLKEAALRHTLTGKEIVSIDSIDKAIDAQIQSQALYQARCPITDKYMLTTPWALTQETETLSRIDRNKHSMKPVTTKSNIQKSLARFEGQSSFSLTGAQSRAITQCLSSRDRFQAIQGYAGTGKTTMLALTKEIAKAQGYQLRGLAVSSSAVFELNHKAGIASDLYQIVRQELLKADNDSLSQSLFILDEASMLSSAQAHEIIKLVEQKGARLVMVGDDAQLPTVKNGRLFGLSQEYGIETAVLDDVIRQTCPNLKQAVTHLVKGDIYDAAGKLDKLISNDTHLKRVERVASLWLSRSQEQRDNTLLFAPTHKARGEITDILREQLKQEGSIQSDGINIETLKPKSIEEIETHYARYYEEGDVIRFNKHARRYRINAGDYLSVGPMGRDQIVNNTLTLINDAGAEIKFHLNDLPEYRKSQAGLERHIELYSVDSKELCEGDTIQWTRNDSSEGIVNADKAKIEEISPDFVKIALSSGEIKEFSRECHALKHLDHGYVFTNYKVQGKDKRHGIGLMESYNQYLTTLKNFYVQVSRGIESIEVVTDDKERLIHALSINDDEKKSAIEHLSASQIREHQEKFQDNAHAIDIASVIDKKIHKEGEWQAKERVISEYLSAKQAENHPRVSEMAFKIVSDKSLLRMAHHHIGAHQEVYRKEAMIYASRVLKDSLSALDKANFAVVEQYVNASQNAREAFKALASHQLGELSDNNAKFDSLQEKAFIEAALRNKLAQQITQDISTYQPYLQHFSIGELNRMGVSEHKIGAESAKSLRALESLEQHSKKHALKLDIDSYFADKNPADRGALALSIQFQSKAAHPYLIHFARENTLEINEVWRDINLAASLEKQAEYREGLSIDRQRAFDDMTQYKAMGCKMAVLGEQYLSAKLEGDEESIDNISQQLHQYSVKRNAIAMMAVENKEYAPILEFFKLSQDKLQRQAQKHQYRDNVVAFKASNSDFKQKMAFASMIGQDIKAHYPYILEQGINKGRLNQFIRLNHRSEYLQLLSSEQRESYLEVMRYRHAATKAGQLWKGIYQQKKDQKNVDSKQMEQAISHTAKRDALAKTLAVNSEARVFFEREHISASKVLSHANNHNQKLRELKELREIRHALLTELEQKQGVFDKTAARAWYDKWRSNERHLGQVRADKNGYQKTLLEYPIVENHIPQKHLSLLDTYQLSGKREAFLSPNAGDRGYRSIDATMVIEQLMSAPEESYRAIFGEPKRHNSREMRYAGGLIVTLKGSASGLWYDHTEGKGGNPINAIMRENNVGFKEALQIASELSGAECGQSFKDFKSLKEPAIDKNSDRKAAIMSARSIWRGSKEIKNTLTEAYLSQHRGIRDPSHLNVKFWPKGATWLANNDEGKLVEMVNKIPALVIPAYNDKGHITAVQRVYLDEKTGNKNTFMENSKLSKGVIKGSAGIIQKGDGEGRLYIAEGPETAASIAQVDKNATVLVSFGLSNISSLDKLIQRHKYSEVIIAGDRDINTKVNIEKLTYYAKESLHIKGINARVILPQQIENNPKTDWNDVLLKCGDGEVSKQLGIDNNGLAKEKIHTEIAKDNHRERQIPSQAIEI